MQRILEGKTGLVLGVANKRSIAWACAQSLATAGMRLALTYQGERMEAGVRELAAELEGSIVLPCDVTRTSLDELFATLKELGGLDAMVHAIAFAKREGSRANSSIRRGRLGRRPESPRSPPRADASGAPLMEGRSSSIVTLSYIGGERVVPNFGGVAKAALEAASGISRATSVARNPVVRSVPACERSPRPGSRILGDLNRGRASRCAATSRPTRSATPVSSSRPAHAESRAMVYVDAGYHVMVSRPARARRRLRSAPSAAPQAHGAPPRRAGDVDLPRPVEGRSGDVALRDESLQGSSHSAIVPSSVGCSDRPARPASAIRPSVAVDHQVLAGVPRSTSSARGDDGVLPGGGRADAGVQLRADGSRRHLVRIGRPPRAGASRSREAASRPRRRGCRRRAGERRVRARGPYRHREPIVLRAKKP